MSHTKVDKIAKAAGIMLAAAESGKRVSTDQRGQIISRTQHKLLGKLVA